MVELSPQALRLKEQFLSGDMGTLERGSTIVPPTYEPHPFATNVGFFRKLLRGSQQPAVHRAHSIVDGAYMHTGRVDAPARIY